MGSFYTVLKFHLKENVTSKSFSISCMIILAFVVGFFGINHFTSETERSDFAYLNNSENLNIIPSDFNELQETALLEEVSSFEEAEKQIQDGELSGLFVISDKDNTLSIDHLYKGMPHSETVLLFENYVYQQDLENLMSKDNISPEVVTEVLTKPITTNISISEQEKNVGIVYFFLFMLYIFIIMFGQTLANGIVSEKTTRVMEMMLPKVKPIKMMYAKIFAILLTGITQILLFPIGFLIARSIGWANTDSLNLFGFEIDLSTITLSTFGLFVLYFTLGFILYALIFAALGSAVNRSEDLQGLLTPMMILIIGSFFIAMNALFEPNSTLVTITSYVPFSSPMVTFTRIVLGEAALLEVIISLTILVLTIALLSVLASRIYKNGVMKYSSKVTLKDIFKMAKK